MSLEAEVQYQGFFLVHAASKQASKQVPMKSCVLVGRMTYVLKQTSMESLTRSFHSY